MVPILGGLGKNAYIMRIDLSNTSLDEPSCLQLANSLITSSYIETVEIANAGMGPKGAGLVLGVIEQICSRLKYVDVSGNKIGSYAIVPLAKALVKRECAIKTLNVSNNVLDEDGGLFIAKALMKNYTCEL
jgi:Ran GTPase-activating protein (RanGAP) involved in mRNA processing and transport